MTPKVNMVVSQTQQMPINVLGIKRLFTLVGENVGASIILGGFPRLREIRAALSPSHCNRSQLPGKTRDPDFQVCKCFRPCGSVSLKTIPA